jgi:alkylation response protein AidB-like acyl-CoA dehydrogenase
MCLHRAPGGTDLALLRSRAQPDVDGSFEITGSKIFISGGEQDRRTTSFIWYWARLPDAPAGSRASVCSWCLRCSDGQRKCPELCALEHKMGIKGASTCVMNFDGGGEAG